MHLSALRDILLQLLDDLVEEDLVLTYYSWMLSSFRNRVRRKHPVSASGQRAFRVDRLPGGQPGTGIGANPFPLELF
jgi:hypothetical protein